MIKINLAKLKTAALADLTQTRGMGGAGLSGLTKITRIDMAGLKDFPLRQMLIAFLLIFVGGWIVDDYKTKKLTEADASLAQISGEVAKARGVIAKMAEFEKQRVALEKDEAILKSKVVTLKQLKDGREDTARAMVTLSRSVPNEMWIDTLAFKPDETKVTGFATDTNFISDFMKSLGTSPYFGQLDLEETTQKKDDKQILFNYFSVKGTKAAMGAK